MACRRQPWSLWYHEGVDFLWPSDIYLDSVASSVRNSDVRTLRLSMIYFCVILPSLLAGRRQTRSDGKKNMPYHRHPGLWEKVVSWPYLFKCCVCLERLACHVPLRSLLSNSSFFLLFLSFRCLFCPLRPPANLFAVVAKAL